MNQNYQFLDTGSSAYSKKKRSALKPPLEQSGFVSQLWRYCCSHVTKPFATANFLLLLLMFTAWNGYSQVPAYGFSHSVGTYTPITGGTVLGNTSIDEQVFNNNTAGQTGPITNSGFPIGFNFTYNGTSFDKFAVATNGYIVLGTGSFAIGNTTTTALSSTATGFANLISGFNQDLQGQTGSSISYLTIGSAPNRTLVVQWSNFKRYLGSGTMNYNFQIRLNEGSNNVEVVYGTMATVTAYTAQIGLRGATNAAYNNRTTTTNWAATTAGTSNTSTVSLSGTVFPASGTTFTFAPPVPCEGTPEAGNIAATSQTVCSGSTPAAIAATDYSTGVTGISFQWEQSTNGTDWANATGGTGATTATYTPPSFGGTAIMYRLKATCAGSGSTDVTNSATIAPPAAPATQASALTASNYNANSLTLTWTAGSGNRRMVVISNAAIVDPADGSGPALTTTTTYAGTGQQTVYDGTGATVTITGLVAGGVYNVKVYDYQRCGLASPYTYYYNLTTGTNAITHTSCSAITSLPWTESFESATTGTTAVGRATALPNCWNSQSTQWSTSSAAVYNTARTGTKYLRYAWSTTNAYMWTPGFYLEAGQSYDFSFYAQGDGYTSYTNAVFVNTAVSTTGATELTPAYSPAGPGSAAIQPYVLVTRAYTPATSGTYYFAIRGNEATGSPWYMAFDDFELKESADPDLPPVCATAVSPANGATGIARNTTLSWSGAVLTTTSYDVYFGTSATPALVGNQVTTTYSPGLLAANTQYFWKIVAKNANGDAIDCVTWSFTTNESLNYCRPTTTDGCTDGDVIARVILNTLDNNSGTGCPSGLAGYSDYTNSSSNPSWTTTLQAGSVYAATVYAGQYSEGYAAWIDYNDDGEFSASERIGYSNGRVQGSGTVGVLGSSASFQIALACNPAVGAHRLRVRAMFDTDGINVTPCGNNEFGEIEDYTVTITEAAACPQPSTLAAANVTATTANLSWTLGCAETAWEVAVQTAGSGTPASGVASASTTYAASDLSPGTNYEFYVRANCGPDGTSVWTGPFAFATPPNAAPQCATVVAPADGATGVVLVNGGTTLSWNAPTTGQAATSYKIYAGTNPAALTLVTTVATTSVVVNNIPEGTVYWRVVPSNVVGDATGCPVWSFSVTYPAGEVCGTAIDLATLTSPYNGTTEGAIDNYLPGCDASAGESPDLFYYIDVPANYTLNIAHTNDYDSVIFVGYGTCAAITQISCFDEPDTQATSWMNTTGATQRVFWVQDGYSDDSGTFTLTWTLVDPPACTPPSALTPVVNGNSAVVSWTASSAEPANGYQYELRSSGAAGSGNTGLVSGATVTALQTNNITGLTIGSTYTLYVRSLCSAESSSSWASVSFLVPVANDFCANAITIACGQTITASTVGSTNENMAVCGISGVTTQSTAGVWYKFTGDGSDVTLTTCGGTGTPDTRIAVYTGACGTMTCVAGNDDNAACTANTVSSEVLFSTVNGTEYFILMYNWNTTAAFSLTMSCVVPCTPATTNDDCATAGALTVGTPLATNNTCSSASSGVAYPGCGNSFATYYDTWYTFNSGSNTSLEVSVTGASSPTTGFILYTGACGTLTPVTNSCVATGVATNVTLTASTNYYVRVYTVGAAGRGNFTLSVKVPCARPTAVTSSLVDINTATISWSAPATGAPGAGYEYEVRTSGAAGSGATGLAASGATTNLSVGLTGLAADTAHSVYVRAACAPGDYSPWTAAATFTTLPSCPRPTGVNASAVTATAATIGWVAPATAPANGYMWEVRTSGAAGSGATGLFGTAATAGLSVNLTGLVPATTYSIYVRSNCGEDNIGSWTAAVTFRTKVANDACADAITISCGQSIAGTTVDATNEAMAICGIAGDVEQNSGGVWYKYVSNGSDVTFSTCATGAGDTRIAIYSGTCGTLTCVAGNDDNASCTLGSTFSSEVLLSNTTAGATYHILVFGFSDTTPLAFNLSATCAPVCAPAANNDECATALTIQTSAVTATNNTCASASAGVAYPSCGSSFATFYDTWYKFNSGANGSLTVSASATSPTVVRLAVYSGACGSLTQIGCDSSGSAINLTGLAPQTDYYIRASSTALAARGNFSISFAIPCTVPTGVTATNQGNSAAISWTAASNAPLNGYQYEVRTSGAAGSGATGLFASGSAAGLSATVSGLAANTSYSVYVRSACGDASYSSWTSATTFFTGYCTPAPTSVNAGGITNVTFATVNNTTGAEAGNYADYTAMSGSAVRTEPLTVNVTTGAAQYVKIWVDFNNDMDFTDAGELVYTASATGSSVAAALNIPSSAPLGAHRMRIGAGPNTTFIPCYTGANGSFEDYTLELTSLGAAHLNATSCNSTVNNFAQNIFANNVTGATAYRFRVASSLGSQVLETTNPYFKLNMLSSYAYGVTYNVDVSVNVGGVWSDYGSSCKIYTQAVTPTTQLQNCGATVNNFTTAIYANLVQLATIYRFEVVSSAGTVILDRPNAYFMLNMVPGHAYGVTYTVRVNALANGVWSGYGAACTVSTIGQLPPTQLRAADCGATIPSFATDIYANVVPLAQTYHFTVSSVYGTVTLDRPNAFFRLNMLPQYDYNTTYTVSVTASAPGAVTSSAGSACTVTSAAVPPTTTLRSADCGATIANRNVTMYPNLVAGAVTYRFRMVSTDGTFTITRAVGNFKLSMFPAGSIDAGETVTMDVQTVSANGSTSAWGAACNVTLSNFAGRPGTPVDNDGGAPVSKVTGHPNPFVQTFSLELTSESQDDVHVMVYDMTGKLVEQRDVTSVELPSLKLGANLASGVYNLIVTQGDTVKTLKVIKTNN